MYWVGCGDLKLVYVAYYCPYCYNLFEEAALAETSDLFAHDEVNEDAAAVQLDELLHLTKKKKDRRKPPYGRGPSMVMSFPVDLIIGRLPFKRYYLTGDELVKHTEEARQKMCVEVASGS